MPPTLLKSAQFWWVSIGALVLDILSKLQWGEIYQTQSVWAGWALLAMLTLFLSRLTAVRLSRPLVIGLALLTAGIVGNAMDIVVLSGVRDWFSWFSWQTNLADTYIWVGLLMWIWGIKKSSAVGPERI